MFDFITNFMNSFFSKKEEEKEEKLSDFGEFKPPKFKIKKDASNKIKVKDIEKHFGIEFPKSIDKNAIVNCSEEWLQDNVIVGSKLKTPNLLGDIKNEEIENWSDGQDILEKMDMSDVMSRVKLEKEFCNPYE